MPTFFALFMSNSLSRCVDVTLRGRVLVWSTIMRLIFVLCEILLEKSVIAGTEASSGAT